MAAARLRAGAYFANPSPNPNPSPHPNQVPTSLTLSLTRTPTLTLTPTPGAYFGDCLSLEDIDEMNIEIIRNTLYKAYLEDFHSFCQKARSPY